jgi:hypothetical protein
VPANNENKKDSTKSKRAYALGYGYHDFDYDHEIVGHAPLIDHASLIEHAPLIHHEPPSYIATPLATKTFIPAAPLITKTFTAPIVAAPIAKTAVLSTSVHRLHSAPFISSSYIAHPPAIVAPHPLFTEFHR